MVAQVAGGLMCLGSFYELRSLGAVESFRDLSKEIENMPKAAKVARIVTEVLKTIGKTALCVGGIAMGVSLVLNGPVLGFFASLLVGVKTFLPYMAVSIPCLAIGAWHSRKDPGVVPPREQFPVAQPVNP